MTNSATRLLADYSSRTLARARNYVNERRVVEIDAEADQERLTARVQGTRGAPYAVTVDWSSGYADGDCDCPVGLDCKHAAAAVLTFFAARAPDADKRRVVAVRHRREGAVPTDNHNDPVLREWLERLGKRDEPPQATTGAGSREAIVYLLDLKSSPGLPCLRLKVCKARQRKDGSYAGVDSYNPQNALSGRVAQFIHEDDLEIFYRLLATKRGSLFEYSLVNDRDAKLLAPLLQTGRCHWLSADSAALHLDAPRHGQWEWTLDDIGRQRLTVTIHPSAQTLPLSPPWYVDVTTGDCGALQTGLPAELAQTLLQSPFLDPWQAEQMQEVLDQRLPAKLPRPRKISVEVHKDCAPQPMLRLDCAAERNSWHSLVAGYSAMSDAWAELRFDYEGMEIGAADRRTHIDRLQNERVLRIERNLQAEREASRELGGFFPISGFKRRPATPDGAMTLGYDEESWLDFIVNDIPRLERKGWRIEMAPAFPLQTLSDDVLEVEIEDGESWFGLGLGVVVNGERINLLPLLLEALAALPQRSRLPELIADDTLFHLPVARGRTLSVPAARLKPVLAALIELYDQPALDAAGRMRLSRLDAARLADLDVVDGLEWSGGDALRALGEKLRHFRGIEPVTVPPGFHGTLRDYQQTGLDWLQFLRSYNFGGILADDMGLGKTVQTLAHLLIEKQTERAVRPSLLIVPTSLLHNWCDEAARFAPSLRVLTLHGAERRQNFSRIDDYDMVLSTYPLLPRDADTLQGRRWHYVILDEAQVIKNPRTRAARIAAKLEANYRLCLTGTPMENHLGELWSLFHFLMPGFLGDSKAFRRLYRTPIEKHNDVERRAHLARRVRPFLLRRTKDEVAAELPPKTVMVRTIELEGAQRDLYESVRLAMHRKIREMVASKGLARSQIEILEALLKLRQVCCDPRLLKGRGERRKVPSAKLARLRELLSGLLEDGRRVLLFSQFTEMLGLIEEVLEREQIEYTKLTGSTRDRALPVRRFQSGAVPLMLVSLRAGGTGLNLTAADAVIHYDPWWNPAVEAQATDRAHRIGQDKPVFVYKLICAGTVEERIQALQQRKQALLQSVYGQDKTQNATLSSDDLQMLFEPLAADTSRLSGKRHRKTMK